MSIILELNGGDPYNLTCDTNQDALVIDWENCRESFETATEAFEDTIQFIYRNPSLNKPVTTIIKELTRLIINHLANFK